MGFSLGHHKVAVYTILFSFIAIEIIWNWRKGKKVYNVKDSATNLAIFTGYQLSKLLFTGYQLAFLGIFYRYRLFTLGNTLPVFLLTFLCVDFSYYWFHRASHVIKFFWAFHLVHHTSQHMNLTVAYRLHWLGALISPLFFIPMALIGLPPAFIAGSYGINLLYQFFLHTEAVGRLGLLENIIDTPSSHRVHHGSNEHYIDKNFGGVLIIWDKIFGTYQREDEKPQYGVTTGFAGHNPFELVFRGFYDMITNKMHYRG